MQKVNDRPLVYLACPYTHEDPQVALYRVDIANQVAGALIKRGMFVFSPITHSHPIATTCGLPGDWQFWQKYDEAFLSCCHTLIVLCLLDWEKSVGVHAEIEIARTHGIKIIMMENVRLRDDGEFTADITVEPPSDRWTMYDHEPPPMPMPIPEDMSDIDPTKTKQDGDKAFHEHVSNERKRLQLITADLPAFGDNNE
jgi:hypothetical protein